MDEPNEQEIEGMKISLHALRFFNVNVLLRMDDVARLHRNFNKQTFESKNTSAPAKMVWKR